MLQNSIRYRPQDLGFDPNDPEVKGRIWNAYKGTFNSHARDPWMLSNYRIDPDFIQWLIDYKQQKFNKPADLPTLNAEIRNNFVRANDLWSAYQLEVSKQNQKQQEAKAIAEGKQKISRVDGTKHNLESWEQRENYMRQRDAAVKKMLDCNITSKQEFQGLTDAELKKRREQILEEIARLDQRITNLIKDLKRYKDEGKIDQRTLEVILKNRINLTDKKKSQLQQEIAVITSKTDEKNQAA